MGIFCCSPVRRPKPRNSLIEHATYEHEADSLRSPRVCREPRQQTQRSECELRLEQANTRASAKRTIRWRRRALLPESARPSRTRNDRWTKMRMQSDVWPGSIASFATLMAAIRLLDRHGERL